MCWYGPPVSNCPLIPDVDPLWLNRTADFSLAIAPGPQVSNLQVELLLFVAPPLVQHLGFDHPEL